MRAQEFCSPGAAASGVTLPVPPNALPAAAMPSAQPLTAPAHELLRQPAAASHKHLSPPGLSSESFTHLFPVIIQCKHDLLGLGGKQPRHQEQQAGVGVSHLLTFPVSPLILPALVSVSIILLLLSLGYYVLPLQCSKASRSFVVVL